MRGNWKTSYYAEVFSKTSFKGLKAIVRGKDGLRRAKHLFPDGSHKIRSFILYGKDCTASPNQEFVISNLLEEFLESTTLKHVLIFMTSLMT